MNICDAQDPDSSVGCPLRPQISVVIPVFNERDNIAPLTAELCQALAGMPAEILFVDDGSTDDSVEVLRRMIVLRPNVRAVVHKRNSGQSAALASGFRWARGEILVTLDGDLQNDPADLPQLVAALAEGVDCVCGVRARRRDSWIRRASSRLGNGFRNLLLGETVADSGCNFRVFRRECLQELFVFNGFHRFVPTLLRLQGYRVVEFQVGHRPRSAGVSKYGIHNRLWRGLRDCLAMRWYRRRVVPARRLAGELGRRSEASNDTDEASGAQTKVRGTGIMPLLVLFVTLATAGLLLQGGSWLSASKGWLLEEGARSRAVFVAASSLGVALGFPRLSISFIAGTVFGWLEGLAWSWLASILGAWLLFTLIRRGWRHEDPVWQGRLRSFGWSPALAPGVLTVVAMRQLPLPGWVISGGLALTSVHPLTYLSGTSLGMFPEAALAAMAGAGLLANGKLAWLQQLFAGFALLALVIWGLRRAQTRRISERRR